MATKLVKTKGNAKQPPLPPGVEIWADPEADVSAIYGFMLVDRIPFSPSRFVLKRGYPSREAALAEAWDVLMAHQVNRTHEALQYGRAADRLAEKRLRQKTPPTPQTNEQPQQRANC